ncbi:hypothetical protein CSOJ01_00245 [Colletotrichum sojae]|uniref:DUF2293 domain-containing protein n=1 Tax=Colletotrichum sojae TaxID=2175907 RepID=A0A8H6N5S7_9PEZI|nr:hypothetical protein CSOJ01_00245 [Colletotrichum sojae]
MGREKRAHPGLATAKDRHKRAGKITKAIDRSEPLPPGLVAAKPMNAVTKSKHQSYFEFIENKDKKKPLLFEITADRAPPPGMTHIPIGNPELTERCKEISREDGASVYIVTRAKKEASELSQQIHRVGHHIREYIVERAMRELGQESFYEAPTTGPDDVEKIPDSQAEINRQADAALRELFPRIPHTDRQQIIDHAFKKGKQFKGEPVVGLQRELSLSRRVQLAVLAHIRHSHTRYDALLRETSWHNARRATEQLCLDILVKWRGDDENGRNQLDEILREVVVLSDDSDENSDEEPDSDSSAVLTDRSVHTTRRVSAPAVQCDPPNRNRLSTAGQSGPGSPRVVATSGKQKRILKKQRRKEKHRARNFGRYGAEAAREAARNAAWTLAMERQRRANSPPPAQAVPAHLPPGSSLNKVNEFGNVVGPTTLAPEGPRQLRDYQLQDFLHPSIEPRSPDVAGPPRYNRPLVQYGDLADEQPRRRLPSPPRHAVGREDDRYLPRQVTQSYPAHARPFPDGHGLSRAPVGSYYDAPQGPAQPPVYGVPRPGDPFMRGNEAVLGDRCNPILIEDQQIHSQTIVLSPGESVRDRFGPDVEILSVHRPPRDLVPVLERRHVVPRDEGFIRLRENRLPEYRDSMREEGFLRIREHPDTLSRQPVPMSSGRPLVVDPFQYRPIDLPEQAMYGRRIERVVPAEFTYPGNAPPFLERVTQGNLHDFRQPAFNGPHAEQYSHHSTQGAHGIPVHRQARPPARLEGTGFERYSPIPRRQPQWPVSDDVIVLD